MYDDMKREALIEECKKHGFTDWRKFKRQQIINILKKIDKAEGRKDVSKIAEEEGGGTTGGENFSLDDAVILSILRKEMEKKNLKKIGEVIGKNAQRMSEDMQPEDDIKRKTERILYILKKLEEFERFTEKSRKEKIIAAIFEGIKAVLPVGKGVWDWLSEKYIMTHV